MWRFILLLPVFALLAACGDDRPPPGEPRLYLLRSVDTTMVSSAVLLIEHADSLEFCRPGTIFYADSFYKYRLPEIRPGQYGDTSFTWNLQYRAGLIDSVRINAGADRRREMYSTHLLPRNTSPVDTSVFLHGYFADPWPRALDRYVYFADSLVVHARTKSSYERSYWYPLELYGHHFLVCDGYVMELFTTGKNGEGTYLRSVIGPDHDLHPITAPLPLNTQLLLGDWKAVETDVCRDAQVGTHVNITPDSVRTTWRHPLFDDRFNPTRSRPVTYLPEVNVIRFPKGGWLSDGYWIVDSLSAHELRLVNRTRSIFDFNCNDHIVTLTR